MGVVSCGTTMLDQGVFENLPVVTWDTTPKTSTFSAASGNGYFCNTSGGAFTVNLPGGSAGDIISVADYAATWQTNNLTVSPNGSDKIGGVAATVTLNTEGQSVTFVFVDSTQGWINTMDSTSNVRGNSNLTATGGTITCSGNFKIHTFTGPGTFTVTNLSTTAAENTVGYMVVAGGGGGGGGDRNGAGGAGGFREGRNVPIDNFTASPLVANAPTNAVTVTAQAYPITVGGGGAGGVYSGSGIPGTKGSDSIFSSITSTGGGFGGGTPSPSGAVGGPGGSGGGTGIFGLPNPGTSPNAAGNTPPVSPSQGNQGGAASFNSNAGSGGGGGAGAVGQNACGSVPGRGGDGGAGITTSINNSPVTRAGGGGGAGDQGPRPGGSGGGGAAGPPSPTPGVAGTTNTGSGGGSGGLNASVPGTAGGAGGSGLVIIRYKFQ